MLEDTTPQSIPSEGWSLWYDNVKLTNLGREAFDMIIQQKYLHLYWTQECRLGAIFDLIDWEACGSFVQTLSPIQWVHATKWMTGWLPVAKNMYCWKFWNLDVCPCCMRYQEMVVHLLNCSKAGMTAI